MKTSNHILTFAVLSLLLTACGGTSYQKEPVSDLPELRKSGQEQMQNGDEQAKQDDAKDEKIEKLEKQNADLRSQLNGFQAKYDESTKANYAKLQQQNEELRRQLNQEREESAKKQKEQPTKIVVHDEKEVRTESATITGDYFIIAPDSEIMTFVEGESTSYKIHARAVVPGVKIKLVATDLPQGAQLVSAGDAKQPDLYVLTYKPALYTVPVNDADRLTSSLATLKIEIVSSEKQDKNTLQGLVRDRQVMLNVIRNAVAPSNVTVENFPEQIKEGTQVAFAVVAVIPGIDGNTPTKPQLVISGDNFRQIAGKNYLEQSAYPLVTLDLNHRDAEYLGDSKWRFYRILDAKNTPIALERATDLSALKDSTVTHYNLSLTVLSPFLTTAAPVLKQLQVQRAIEKSIDAPRFDLSGVNAQAIELTPGEAMQLSFTVATLDQTGEVKVEVANLATLAGAPAATCQVSAKGKSQQDCVIKWTVPCTAADKDLAQTVAMSAYAIQDGRNSQVTQQNLKTVRSKKAAAAQCTQGADKTVAGQEKKK